MESTTTNIKMLSIYHIDRTVNNLFLCNFYTCSSILCASSFPWQQYRSLRMAHVIAQNNSSVDQASRSACAVLLLRRPRPPASCLKQQVKPNADGPRIDEADIPELPQPSSPAHPTPLSSSTLSNSLELVHATDLSLVHPLYPRGPDFLPPGRVIKVTTRPAPSDQRYRAGDADLFALDNFQQAPETLLTPKQSGYKAVSRENYLKLTSWFAANAPKQEFVNTVNVEGLHDVALCVCVCVCVCDYMRFLLIDGQRICKLEAVGNHGNRLL